MPSVEDDDAASGYVTVTFDDTNIKVQSSLPHDHTFYALIGRVASEWTNFEHALDHIIWELSEFPVDVAICVTGQMMGAHSRFKAIEALLKHRGVSSALLVKLRRLKNDQHDAGERRNRVVHDPWFLIRESTSEPGSGTEAVNQLKSSPPGHTPISEDEIRETLRRIRILVNVAVGLCEEVKSELRTLRGK